MKIKIWFIYFFMPSIIIPWSVATKRTTSGPFSATITHARKCNKTTYPLEKDPSILFHLEVYQAGSKKMVRGNLTVVKERKKINFKVNSYVWKNDMWKQTYIISSLGCRSVLIDSMQKVIGVKYNRERCEYIKGTYLVSGLDVDKLQHMWTSKAEYGKLLWTMETYNGKLSYYCWEMETLIMPLN